MRKHSICFLGFSALLSCALFTLPMQAEAVEGKIYMSMQLMPVPKNTDETLQQAQSADYVYRGNSSDEKEIVYF